MAAKLAVIFVAVFLFVQFLSYQSDATIIRRDAPVTQKNDLDETINSIKQGFEEFISKVQNSEVFQNASKLLDEFGKKVKQQGDEIYQQITTKDDTPKN